MATKTPLTEVNVPAMSSKDSIILSNSTPTDPITLEDIVRGLVSLDTTIASCSNAKAILNERLNSFSEADINKAFGSSCYVIKGKKYQVQHKVTSDMTYDVHVLEAIPEAAPYLTKVEAFNKFDKAAFNKDMRSGIVDPKVSSVIVTTLTESNVLKEVK